jgi:hypothetical protein
MAEELRRESSDYFWDTFKELESEIARVRESGDKHLESKKLGHLGGHYCFHWPGDIQHAVDYYQHAVAIAREIGNKHLGADHLHGLGTCYGTSELVSNRIPTSTTHSAASGRRARVLVFRWEAVHAATGTPSDQPPLALL